MKINIKRKKNLFSNQGKRQKWMIFYYWHGELNKLFD